MAIEIRTITDDEAPVYHEALMQTFGHDAGGDPEASERLRALVDRAQTWAAFDGATLVGTAATFQLVVGIPGGSLPMAGLTMVTVRPTHRRRGLLRELMQRHLDDARARGYAISGLWASEAVIYGRFGYGVAAEHDAVTIQRAHALQLADGARDDVAWIDEARAREVFPEVYARATADRPGVLRRTAAWWQWRRFSESPWARGGASKLRFVVAQRGDTVVGYVCYRQRTGGADPGGKVELRELFGVDARAEASLWRFVLTIDLFPHVHWWCAPTDDALALAVSDSRKVERSRTDNLWLRIEDIAAALEARRYAADGVLRFAVDGARFELTAAGGRGTCAPTTHTPGLEIDRRALASLYLGGFTASRLARASLVRGEPGVIAIADRLFAWPVAPWCPEVF